MGAHEQDRLAANAGARKELVEGVSLQLHVTPSLVAARSLPCDQPDLLEHVEVVRHQVRLDAGEMAQLDRGAIRDRQLVDDRQADRIAQRAVPCGTQLERGKHRGIISLNAG